ncbi:MAG: NnrU family protein [Ideonella sp.]|nr:NnrU family protein [Ideonella sp.]MCC7457590.1 NnrU family protein [Nitrospira sp.]
MTALILGLVLFLGVHSTRIVADGTRTRFIALHGQGRWKGLYSLASAVGLVLLVWGYSAARQQPVPLWAPQPWARHLASLLTLLAFVLVAAAYVPGNAIKARLGHPMLLGVKLWAFAHLLANHTLADLLLFGGFLLWAVLCLRAARARDRVAGLPPTRGRAGPTVVAVVAGALAWAVFALWLHSAWIGVRPF